MNYWHDFGKVPSVFGFHLSNFESIAWDGLPSPFSANVLWLQTNLISSSPLCFLSSCGLCFHTRLICSFHHFTLFLPLDICHICHLGGSTDTVNSWKGGTLWPPSPPHSLHFCLWATGQIHELRGYSNSAINCQTEDRWQVSSESCFFCVFFFGVLATQLFKNMSILIHLAQLVRNLPANAADARDSGLIPGSGGSPEKGNGNLLQYYCLKNSMDRGASRVTVHGVAKSWTCLSLHTHTHTHTQLYTGMRIITHWCEN